MIDKLTFVFLLFLAGCGQTSEIASERPAAWAQPREQIGVPNLFKVNDALYRSAQPSEEGMANLKEMGIKTIVNLRSFHSDRDEIGETGLGYEHIYMKAWHPEYKEVVRFLKVVNDPARTPVLVHCQHGADRTGTMCALYRVAAQGWTKDEAIREMTGGGFGFHSIWTNLPKWIQKIDIDAVKSDTGIRIDEGWKLVWCDEFEYEGLPDPAKWDYEEGFVRNKEMQYYTRAREKNARVDDGLLMIEGRKEEYRNPGYKAGSDNWKEQRETASYTAAGLITLGKASWKYGRIEVRAKLPQGKGVWPAIWMLGQNRSEVQWPKCGEIDIMEFIGKEPSRVYGTVHFHGEGKHKSNGGKVETKAPYEDFHIYAIEWNEEKIDFFFDDIQYHTFVIDTAGEGADNPFRKPQYLLINLALGGSWGGPIDDSMLPQKYLIDYVRVYESTAIGKPDKDVGKDPSVDKNLGKD